MAKTTDSRQACREVGLDPRGSACMVQVLPLPSFYGLADPGQPGDGDVPNPRMAASGLSRG